MIPHTSAMMFQYDSLTVELFMDCDLIESHKLLQKLKVFFFFSSPSKALIFAPSGVLSPHLTPSNRM